MERLLSSLSLQPTSKKPYTARESMDITDSFQKISLQSDFMKEAAEIKCGTPDMAKMSFEEVAEYIGTLRSTIKKLQDTKPQQDISDMSDDSDYNMNKYLSDKNVNCLEI